MNKIKMFVSGATVFSMSMLSVFGAFIAIEPSVAYAVTDDVVITLNVDSGISITSPADTSMSRNIGFVVDSAIATTTWNVKTNSATGYTLKLTSSSNPAMQSGGNSINNFATGSSTVNSSTPGTWIVDAGKAEFGYSGYGTDTSTGTWGSGSSCGTAHTPSATLKYAPFATSNGPTLATRAASTTTSGIDTTVCYSAEQDTTYIASGTYTATITATAVTI